MMTDKLNQNAGESPDEKRVEKPSDGGRISRFLMGANPVIPKLYYDAYSDEQRIKALWDSFNEFYEYVNALSYYYIPNFMGTWNATTEYPPYSIVEDPSTGDSYTSLAQVPAGTPLSNETYWAKTGKYNQQFKDLQDTVESYDGRITGAQNDADAAQAAAENAQAAADAADNKADTKAPISHASAQTTYGQGTSSLFGHVKLYNATGTQTDGGITPAAVKSYVDAQIASATQTPGIIVIGDSWSANTGVWEKVSEKLGLTLYKYAVSSMGFIQGTTNFQVQLQSAVSDHKNDNIAMICIYGLSNDYSHGYTQASMFETPLTSMNTLINQTWPDAQTHVFFNSRLKYGDNWIDYGKMNKQLSLVRELGGFITGSTNMIAHVDSVCWIGHDYYGTDFVHPTTLVYNNYLPMYLARSLTGGNVDYYQTNRQLVNLTGNNATGNISLSYTPYELQIIAYLNLTANFEQSAQPFTLDSTPLQVAIWQDDRASNQTSISIGKTNGTGSGNMPIQFDAADVNGDRVYLSRIADNPSIPVVTGTYGGSVKARIWS